MIKITKDRFPPEVRFVAGNHPRKGQLKWRVAQQQVINDYRNNPIPFLNGQYTFNADFGYDQFREALVKCQGPKCCFCEKPIYNGTIEHFRPKAGWKQVAGPLTRPGYYWLAYSWANMLISCTECNQGDQKGNLFPVLGVRATTPSMALHLENHEIINPTEDEPSVDITFQGSIPIHLSPRGKLNIDMFKLDIRGDVASIRKDKYDLYFTLKQISELQPVAHITQARIDEAKRKIAQAKNRKQPFAGMILENIKNGNL